MRTAVQPAKIQSPSTDRGIFAAFRLTADWNTPGAQGFGWVLLVLQLLLILLLVERFNLEDYRFQAIVRVALGGFAVHHFLPAQLRLPFFVTLSLSGLAYGLGLEQGGWNALRSLQRTAALIGVGGALIGIVRLPAQLLLRLTLLLLAVSGLTYSRAGFLHFEPLDAVWPVLGGMFMFRLMVYVYDLQHLEQKPSLWYTLGYFFLLPNLWLFVFPVIDFKGFLKSHFSEKPLITYQNGAAWMIRGAIQILLWRLVYYQVYLDPSHVEGGAQVAQYLLSNVLLYLRVSGQFHFVIGLLHLFGFNLPETNHRYFFASSFTDYWRRVNLYWKDFIMKLFYYPLVVRFKALGATASMVTATAIAFVTTWFLHSYQWFWLRGSFPVQPKEVAFWSVLGVLVCWNAYSESIKGRKRTLSKKRESAGDLFSLAGRTAMTFATITLLWSIWSCDSIAQWVDLWKQADLWTIVYFGGASIAIGAAAVAVEGNFFAADRKPGLKAVGISANPFPWRRVALTTIPAVAVVIGSSSHITKFFRPEVEVVTSSLFKNTPNKSDEEYMVRGYYESLMDTVGSPGTELEFAL